MTSIADRVRPKGVKVCASALFTRDMATNLSMIFQDLSEGDRVSVLFTTAGVWAERDDSVCVFIGATEAFDIRNRDERRPRLQ